MEKDLKDKVPPVVEEIKIEKKTYLDKQGESPCDSDDKACHQRWIEAFSDCE